MNSTTGDEFLTATTKFSWIEYMTFGSLLGLSALIGIYFGWFKGNQNTVNEYMLGGKHMRVFPIAMSLIASHISGITLLGIPSEVYEFGTQYLITCLSTVIIVLVTNAFYVPVFYDLQLYSVYEYLEMRFSRVVRLLASFVFMISLVLYIPVVIYIPALAFHQVTGTSVHFITPIICSLCIFYTTIGGLKAVVWTDAIQSLFTLGSVIVVIILGVINVGGLYQVIEINQRGNRIEFFNLDLNMFSRTTFWNIIWGTTTMWICSLTVHPGSAQRFVALPSMKAAKKSVFWFGVGVVVIVSLSGFVGMIMYAKYWNCDPIKAQNLKTSGKILPYFVQDVARSFPGLTGLFISGLISAALSTMSAGLNTLAGTFYEDFVTLCLPKKVSDSMASFIMKIIVIVFGCICVTMVYIVEKLGPIVQMSYSLSSAPNGAIFSAFALGIFFPWANWKGVTTGMITSMLLTGWMVVGAQLALINKDLVFVGKPLDFSGCLMNVTETLQPSQVSRYEEVGQGVFAVKNLFFLYKFAFMYYTPIGCFIGVVVGLLVSLCTGGSDLKNMNPNLITPVMRKFLPKRDNTREKYDPVAQGLKLNITEIKK